MIDSKHVLCFGLLLILCSYFGLRSFAQSPASSEEPEEILLELNVERALIFDLDALLLNDKLYLPAEQLFDRLKIKTGIESEQSILTTYYPNSQKPYRFYFDDQKVEGPDHSRPLSPDDFILQDNKSYILKELLEHLLDLEILFDYRKLSIVLFSDKMLPVIEFHERKERYKNFSEDKTEQDPDVVIPGQHHLFDGWMADWSFNNSHSINSTSIYNPNFSYSMGLGGHLMGGSLSLQGFGSKDYGIHWDRVRGRWAYPVYSSPLIKMIQIGDLFHEDMPGTNAGAFQGFELTNRPNAPRQHFNTYSISDDLENGWDSELYVNRQLKDYVTDNDRFRFTTPLEYGSNLIQLKYYDTDGFNHQKQYLIYVPQDFLPPGEFEYAFSGGKYSNYTDLYFSRLNLKWGLSPNITVGGGTVGETTGQGQQIIPFVQSWARLGSRVIATGSHMLDRRTEGSMRMIFPGSQSLSMNFKKFYEHSVFNKIGKSIEASLNTSFPVRIPGLNFSAFLSSRYNRSQTGNENMYIYSGFSSRLPLRIGLQLNNRLMFRNKNITSFTPIQAKTRVNLSKRILRNLLLRPSLEYDHNLEKITESKLQIRFRVIKDSYFDVSFNRNHLLQNNYFQFSFRMDFPFARHTSSVRSNPNGTTMNQFTTGSIVFNRKQQTFDFNNQSSVGKAELAVHPFLDLNDNGQQDSGEPAIDEFSANISKKGQPQPLYKDQKIFKNLTPYEQYHIRINEEDMSNPLWKAKHQSYTIRVHPNSTNNLSVPVTAAGEVSGRVNLDHNDGSSPATQGLDIQIQSSGNDDFIDTVQTFSGGSFYYVGLRPGTYIATLNREQLSERSLQVARDSVEFTIKPSRQGSIVDNINLNVQTIELQQVSQDDQQVFAVQIGAFVKKSNAVNLARFTEMITDYTITIIYDEKKKLYKCQIGLYKDKQSVRKIITELQRKRNDLFGDAFIIEFYTKPEKLDDN